jgi:hypothetical protein
MESQKINENLQDYKTEGGQKSNKPILNNMYLATIYIPLSIILLFFMYFLIRAKDYTTKQLIMKKVIFMIVLFSLISYLNGVYSINFYNPMIDDKPLYDYGVNHLPRISEKFSNFFATSANAIPYIYLAIGLVNLFLLKNKILANYNIEVFAKYLFVVSVLFIIRISCWAFTNVPPLHKCKNPTNLILNPIKIFSEETNPRSERTCSDMMFSGHTFMTFIMCLFLLFNPPMLSNEGFGNNIIKYGWLSILTILMTIYPFTVVMSGLHYTHDVIVGAFFALFIFFAFNNHILRGKYGLNNISYGLYK